jgi:hypothetical protein
MLNEENSEGKLNAQRKDSTVLWMVALVFLIPIAFFMEMGCVGSNFSSVLRSRDAEATLRLGGTVLVLNWIALGLPLVTLRVPKWAVAEALVIVSILAASVVMVYAQCNWHEFFEPGEFGLTGALHAFLFLGIPLGALIGSSFGYLHCKGYLPTWIAAGIIALGAAASSVLNK